MTIFRVFTSLTTYFDRMLLITTINKLMSIKSDLNDSIVPKPMSKDNQDYYESNLQTVEMIALTALLGYNL